MAQFEQNKIQDTKKPKIHKVSEVAVAMLASADRGNVSAADALKQVAGMASALTSEDLVLVRGAAKVLEKQDPAGFEALNTALSKREQQIAATAAEKKQHAAAVKKADDAGIAAWRNVINRPDSGAAIAKSMGSRGEFTAVGAEEPEDRSNYARVLSPVETFVAQGGVQKQAAAQESARIAALQQRAQETGRPSRIGKPSGEVISVNKTGSVLTRKPRTPQGGTPVSGM